MRDDELVARALGKNIRMLKLEAFFVSCVFAGLAGALYAAYVGFIDPGSAALEQSILMLSMVTIGGTGNLRGPYVGAAILLLIPELLRRVNIPAEVAAEGRLAIYGVLLVLLMHVRPQGVAGKYSYN